MTTVKLDMAVLQRLKRETPARLDALLRSAAEGIVGDIKVSFGTSPAGATYYRGNVAHVASQAGYPPNVDIGTLRASMDWSPGDRPLKYHVHDGTNYGVLLELGTSRMAARPFVAPVFEEWRARKLVDLISTVLD